MTRNCEDYAKTNNLEDYPLSPAHVELFLKITVLLESHQMTRKTSRFLLPNDIFVYVRAVVCTLMNIWLA